jgi:hypothetical protein
MSRTILKQKLSDHGYPTSSRNYPTAHEEADKLEKRKFPAGYKVLKKAVRGLAKHELMGKNTRAGKIEVESKFKHNAKEIAYHERMEHKNLLRLAKKSKK